MPASDTIANTDTNQSDDFNLRLDADEQEAPGKLTPLAKPINMFYIFQKIYSFCNKIKASVVKVC
jgi:hypothetical protein